MENKQNHNAIVQSVQASLRQAEAVTSELRRSNTRLLVTGISASAGATLVAGITAAVGPVVGEGDAGWRLACIVAAIFAFISTVSTGLKQQLKFSDRLSKGLRCVGKLRSLELTITAGDGDRQKIVEEYEKIAETYPEFI